MRSKAQIKGIIFKVMSPSAFKNVIIILGVVVALLVGFFTLHAEPGKHGLSLINPKTGTSNILVIDLETLEIETSPEVLIYDKNLDLVLSANLDVLSDHEKEHLNRLLKVCDLMLSSDNTTIYQLDK